MGTGKAQEYREDLAKRVFGIGSWEWDIEKDVLSVHYGFACQLESFQGPFEKWMSTLAPEEVELIRDTIKRGIEIESEIDFEYKIFAHGNLHFIKVSAKLFRDPPSSKHLIGLNREVTKEANILLQLTTQIEACHHELESLTYAISHDLRAPLRGIDGWSAALLEDCGHLLDEVGHEHLTRVRHEAHHMDSLINDLLRISRINKTKMRFEKVNLSKIADSVSKIFLEEYPEKKINLNIYSDMHVQGDNDFMEIALTNLFSNAFKFSSKKSEINIEFGKMVIDEQMVFFIKDHGIGFDSKTSKKLFGTFQRMHRQNEFPGNGIGLSIVKRIINLHQGKIWAESSINSGAIFFFTLNDRTV